MTLDWTHQRMGGKWVGEEYDYLVTTAPSGRRYRWAYGTGLQYETGPDNFGRLYWTYAPLNGFKSDNLALEIEVAEAMLTSEKASA